MGSYQWSSSVSDMIMALNWPTLEQRCYNSRLIMFYNLVKTNSSINILPHYSSLTSAYNTRQFHPLMQCHGYLTIQEWNKLPNRAIESDSINEFSNYFANN